MRPPPRGPTRPPPRSTRARGGVPGAPRAGRDPAPGPGAPPPGGPAPPLPPLDPGQRRLLDAIERGRGTLAELATTMEEARAASRSLSQLELLGLVRRGFGGRYVRRP